VNVVNQELPVVLNIAPVLFPFPALVCLQVGALWGKLEGVDNRVKNCLLCTIRAVDEHLLPGLPSVYLGPLASQKCIENVSFFLTHDLVLTVDVFVLLTDRHSS